ncbi:MAG: ABC transporter permease [Bacillota bacterium]|uniref:ABC transporter permease n=1 Tax=unclassified Virgibacillus TaxID=2620237 RepID=UPI000EF45D1B|nr:MULTISPECIES: ABC transporter permease [unclassified Virgibacillus]MCC2248687.1 ABC transporter permease [Virgibacillus sp. AGTR]MDY7044979.1 ABC transporter permease [Virgibacillus sp. M23]QRZ18443.1 ABC transporter permease [Virgibacillus sp. AGTR]
MKSALKVIKEQIDHFYLLRRLSIYELKSKNKNNYLGILWEILNPAIQIVIYWFVFTTLRSREDVPLSDGQEVDFFSWLLAAFFLWIFFYQGTIQGSKSIYSRLKMLSKMNFPMSIIPGYVIFSQFYVHLVMLGISIILLNFIGYYASIYYLQLIYYIFAAIALIFALSLITSTLSTIIRDVHMLLNSVLRMFLYISGVLWPLSMVGDEFAEVLTILKLNPLYYLIEGYRAALFGTEWYFITQWEYTLVFWGIVIVLFLFGSMLHVKFRRHFIDYL